MIADLARPLSAAERARIAWRAPKPPPPPITPLRLRPVMAIERHEFRQGLIDGGAGRPASRFAFGPYRRGYRLGAELTAQPLVEWRAQ